MELVSQSLPPSPPCGRGVRRWVTFSQLKLASPWAPTTCEQVWGHRVAWSPRQAGHSSLLRCWMALGPSGPKGQLVGTRRAVTPGAGGTNITQEHSPILAPSSLSECGQVPLPASLALPKESSLFQLPPKGEWKNTGCFSRTCWASLTGLFGREHEAWSWADLGKGDPPLPYSIYTDP